MITDYTSLKTAVLRELQRPNLDPDRLEEAIRAVEVDLEQEDDFVSAYLEERWTVPVEAGDLWVGLPSSMTAYGRTMRQLRLVDAGVVLQYAPPHSMTGRYRDTPRYYALVGQELRLEPVPAEDDTLEIITFDEIPKLSTTNTTNWLLTGNPEIYKWGAVAELRDYVGGRTARRLADAPVRYLRLLDKLVKTARKRRVPRGPRKPALRVGTIV